MRVVGDEAAVGEKFGLTGRNAGGNGNAFAEAAKPRHGEENGARGAIEIAFGLAEEARRAFGSANHGDAGAAAEGGGERNGERSKLVRLHDY